MFVGEEEHDWEVTAEGLYVATRGFLVRRGYCCANRCRNCPYVNWRDDSCWQTISAEHVQRTRVSAKAIAGVREQLTKHMRQLSICEHEEQTYHRAMITHYHFLLEQWHG